MRYLHVLIFTIVYIGLGFLLKLNGTAYLVLGIPLGILFQVFVRKESLAGVFVQGEKFFKFTPLSIAITIGLLIYPSYKIFFFFTEHKNNWEVLTYLLIDLAGAFAGGFAFARLTKKTIRDFFACLLIAGGIGIVSMILAAYAQSTEAGKTMHFNVSNFLISLLTYTPSVFIIEEVVFRGIIDAHVHRPGDKKNFLSALYVSCLWGWWHLPVLHTDTPLIAAIVSLPVLHVLVGVPLSIFWRRSGNLAVPGFTHAFIDAVRNALLK